MTLRQNNFSHFFKIPCTPVFSCSFDFNKLQLSIGALSSVCNYTIKVYGEKGKNCLQQNYPNESK